MSDERMTDIETRIAFLEDAQQQLSDVVARQEKEIERLKNRAEDLETQLREVAPSLVQGAADEKPPHY